LLDQERPDLSHNHSEPSKLSLLSMHPISFFFFAFVCSIPQDGSAVAPTTGSIPEHSHDHDHEHEHTPVTAAPSTDPSHDHDHSHEHDHDHSHEHDHDHSHEHDHDHSHEHSPVTTPMNTDRVSGATHATVGFMATIGYLFLGLV
jgi:hypothetical protein